MAAVQGDVERHLPIVRRGYDPYEVQRLVGALSNEMRALAATNTELKQRLASVERPLRVALEPPDGPALEETRRYAAELLAAAEREGNSIRQRARIDGDRIIELAHRRAGDIEQQHEVVAQQLRAAQEQIAQLVRLLEQRAP
jgi:cell division septum initiation protein DivIVA